MHVLPAKEVHMTNHFRAGGRTGQAALATCAFTVMQWMS